MFSTLHTPSQRQRSHSFLLCHTPRAISSWYVNEGIYLHENVFKTEWVILSASCAPMCWTSGFIFLFIPLPKSLTSLQLCKRYPWSGISEYDTFLLTNISKSHSENVQGKQLSVQSLITGSGKGIISVTLFPHFTNSQSETQFSKLLTGVTICGNHGEQGGNFLSIFIAGDNIKCSPNI